MARLLMLPSAPTTVEPVDEKHKCNKMSSSPRHAFAAPSTSKPFEDE
jgi:hypothetical protein